MAWYWITYSCGHEDREQIYGPSKRREWIVERKAQGLCPECRKEARAARIKMEQEEATREAEEMGLPVLTGTEKQVAWAITIRQKAVKAFERMLEDLEQDEDHRLFVEKRFGLTTEDIEYVYERIFDMQIKASWWIEERSCFGDLYSWFLELIKDLRDKYREIERKETEKPLLDEINKEITVRPEGKVKTETVAEIKTDGSEVKIIFHEKRDDFRQIMRNDLHMTWNGSCWKREIPWYAGTVEDRAAEAGHRLLAAGFIVRIPDETVRQKAVNGEYEEEHTRWIFRRGGGKYDGWFAIWWKKPDDFYNSARKIPGSKWDKPSVVVPPEQFEQVLDFAERYGFRLSEKAQKVAEAARKAKEEALLVNPEPPKKKEAVVDDGKPPVLDVPEVVEIDEELRDDD